MYEGIALAPPHAPVAGSTPPREPHPHNLLLNPRFEDTEAAAGTWRRPAGWHASVCGPAAGAMTAACPAALTRDARHGAGVAWLYAGLHAPGASGRPAALYQTLTLQSGSYRFGGRLGLRIWDAALDTAGQRVLNASQAFLRLYRGRVAFDEATATPTGVHGTLLGSIELSPQRFAAGTFRRLSDAGAMVRFAYIAFETYADTFALDVADPVEVTVQLVVVPVAPAGGDGPLVPLTHVTLLADHVFVEPAVG